MFKTVLSTNVNPIRRQVVLWLAAFLAVAPAARAQLVQKDPHIGYIYPAGGRVGTTVSATVGGQHLDGVTDVDVSGEGVQAAVVKHTKPLTQKEVNELREKVRQAREKAQAAKKDGKAGSADDDTFKKFAKELGVTDEDLKKLDEFQKQRSDPKRQLNPQIAEKVMLRISLSPDAELGEYELRLRTSTGLSNPVRYHVRNLPEVYETEPNDETTATETPEPFPVILNGQILPGDVDRFQFQARKGDHLVVVVSARELIPYLADAVPGWFQATLSIYGAEGNQLAYVDDYNFHPDPVLYYRIPQRGQYVLEINDAIYRGREDFVYRITLGELPFVTSIFPLGGRCGHEATLELRGWNLRARSLKLDAADRPPGVHLISVGGDKRVSNRTLFAVDTLPECNEEEPNDDRQGAQQLKPPMIVNGRIGQPGDWDVFGFAGLTGGRIVAEVQARRLNSPLDSVLKITDAKGRQLMVSDDHEDKGAGLTTHHADSLLTVTLPEDGAYYLHLGDTQHHGGTDYGYRLRISTLRPDFELRVVPSSINARPGTSVPITVYALRRDDFADDISLALKDAPSGFVLSGGWVPAGQDKVRLTLSVPPKPLEKPVNLCLEGRAVIREGKVCRPVVPADDMVQAFIYHHLVPAKNLVVSVSGKPMPLRGKTQGSAPLTFGDEPVKLPAGGTARVQLPSLGAWIVNQIELNEPPEGISIQGVARGTEGPAILIHADAAKVKPGLKGNLIAEAFIRRNVPRRDGAQPGNKRRRQQITLPAIPFEIAPLHQSSP